MQILMQLKFIICVNDKLKYKLRYLIIDRLIIQVPHKAVAEVSKIGTERWLECRAISIYLSICLSVYLSICLSVYLSIYLSVCLFV